LDPTPSAGSLSVYEISNEEAIDFISMSKSVEKGIGTGTGSDIFPGNFLTPKKMAVCASREFVKLLTEYYNNAYETDIFIHSVDLESDKSIGVSSVINQYRRIRISDKVFGSTFSTRYENSSRILAKFSDSDGVTIYPDQVQFFFEHYIDYPEESTKHNLTYVR
jgi:hypothetical protein